MEEKRREAGTQPAASSSAVSGAESSPSEPASSRRRAGGQKRKANALAAANAALSSSLPSKRVTREKNLSSHPPIYNHNGPLTRARGPNNLTMSAGGGGGSAFPAVAGGKLLEMARDDAKLEAVEELNKVREAWEALEAKVEAEFETIRSRDSHVHVVPTHCGWFSWTKVHPLEEQGLPSFFNGKLQDRTPDMYMEIRNWIMKKFHTNPNTQIELKDLSELEVGCLDARQEVMEFLEYWGLINFHPFSPVDFATENAAANADGDGAANADGDGAANADGDGAANADGDKVVDAGDGAAKKESLLDKLYRFEEIQFCPPAAPKLNIISPATTSGLFRESAIAEELVKPEGPAVEYHCNSCSADCSRKRYHCQKQADFDLCTDCFTNGKFGSGMSSSDFILMVPGEAAGVNGGKWTDQETLLLLEALELYKENWNEIAEHVATKTKAQCILHFVQMPIEDVFLDLNDEEDANSKETTDPAATHDVNAVCKDVPETSESKIGADEGPSQTTPMETSKPEDASEVKISEETLKPEDDNNKQKVGDEISKSEVNNDVKASSETGENIALKALREAFEAVGYLPTPESPRSFAEVGNPVMALAAFLSLLVGSDIATVSARSSLKSISGNSPAMQLAARHCFILEDPPGYKKEPAHSESIVAEVADQEAQKVGNSENRSDKEGKSTSVLVERDSSYDNDKITEDSVPEEKRPPACTTEKSTEKSNSAKEPDNMVTPEIVESDKLNESSNAELPKDNPELSSPPSSMKEMGEGASVGDPSPPVEVAKEVASLPDSLPPEREAGLPVTSSSLSEPSQLSSAAKDIDMVPESLPSENNEPEQPVTSSLKGASQPTEVPKDVDLVSDSLPSEVNEPQLTESIIENGTTTTTGEDQTRDNKEEKLDSKETKDDHNIDKIKRAAITALSAAAVKAKLLAEQEEDQIQQLATALIDKQLQKLEAKLAFFTEMDNMTQRVRELLERSKQRLFYERAQIIQARLGLAASSSRAMPSSVPGNRIPMNFANSIARPPISPRPPISKPMGTVASTPSIPFISTTAAGSSIRPSGQDKLSSVGTK